jgi:hypothetical protein
LQIGLGRTSPGLSWKLQLQTLNILSFLFFLHLLA